MGKNSELIFEQFNSISNLLKELDTRTNNSVMRDVYESNSGDGTFSLTKSYEEACSLLKYGYNKILEEVDRKRKELLKTKSYLIIPNQKLPKNMPIGYVPNVPNAIQNIPNSMINIEKDPKKEKSISIIYHFGASWMEKAEDFVKAGVALVSAINILERSGFRTKLSVCFFPAKGNSQILYPTLRLKDYKDNFNIKKLCFPLAHPSMFRRIGFKYCETCPRLTDLDFKFGYGRTIHDTETENKILKEIKQNFDKNCIIINYKTIKDFDYNPEEILKYLNITKERN